jgi:hypothetical protein
MLVTKLFAHMLESGTGNSDEVEGSKIQSLNSPQNNNYESNSSDDGLINLPMLYMGIGAQRYLRDRIKIPRSLTFFNQSFRSCETNNSSKRLECLFHVWRESHNRYRPIPFSITIGSAGQPQDGVFVCTFGVG